MKMTSSKPRRIFWWCAIPTIILVGALVLPVRPLACREPSPRNACINNLMQIDGAKEQWSLEHAKSDGDLIVPGEVNLYIKGGGPKCPAGGTYRYGKVGDDPTCSIPDHVLPVFH